MIVIKIDRPSGYMLVAKGVRTVIAGTERFGLPGLAIASNEELAKLDVTGYEYLMILSDRDNASLAAAYALAARMDREGKKGRVYVPKCDTWTEAIGDGFEGEAN